MNLKEVIRHEIQLENGEEHFDLRKKVLLYIGLEIRWQKNVNNIAIPLYSEFTNKGIIDKLDDVHRVELEILPENPGAHLQLTYLNKNA